MASVTNFLFEKGCDSLGRKLSDYHAFSDREMDRTHDFIQHMFPTTEVSAINPDAPVVTKNDVQSICDYKRYIVVSNLERYCRFLFKPRYRERFFQLPNHNHLRISRVIKSVRLFGLDSFAKDFASACTSENTGQLDNAIPYWDEALTIDLWNIKHETQ